MIRGSRRPDDPVSHQSVLALIHHTDGKEHRVFQEAEASFHVWLLLVLLEEAFDGKVLNIEQMSCQNQADGVDQY
jgi:hypothetical protein